MLCGLCFKLVATRNVGEQCNVDIKNVLAAFFIAYLTDRFKERGGLDIADCAAYFRDYNVNGIGAAVSRTINAILDFVCDVRNNLNGTAKVIAASFLI